MFVTAPGPVQLQAFHLFQELTEEGLPFLVLFHDPNDKESPEIFLEQVNLQLSNDKGLLLFHCLDRDVLCISSCLLLVSLTSSCYNIL